MGDFGKGTQTKHNKAKTPEVPHWTLTWLLISKFISLPETFFISPYTLDGWSKVLKEKQVSLMSQVN